MKEFLEEINQIIIEKSFIKNKMAILEFIKNPQLAYYFFNKIPSNFENLAEIEFLLDEALNTNNHFVLVKILTGSISQNNDEFIIYFIEKNYEKFGGNKLRDELFQEEALQIIKKLLEVDQTHCDLVFNLVKKVVKLSGDEYKKDKYDHKREKEFIADLLLSLSSDDERLDEIIELIKNKFNLTGGGFGNLHGNIHSIFSVLRRYLEKDFKTNLDKITELLTEQYDAEYDGHFEGWEWAGAGISRAGSSFSLGDINFVEQVLAPATRNYYQENNDLDFLISKMVTKVQDVSKNRPDFLNRAILPIIIDLFGSNERPKSNLAYEILKEFIESTKGIPAKSDLIYQQILGTQLSDDKIWELAKIDAEKYDTPTSVFLEQNISNLAARGHDHAKQILKKWQKNPKYYQRFTGGSSVASTISSQLNDNFESAVELFTDFISNEGFINDEYDRFEVYDLSRILSRIIERDFNTGISILVGLKNKSKLGINEQILMCNALSNIEMKGENALGTLLNLYDRFIDPFLSENENNVVKIIEKIPHDNGREQFVKFAELLVENGGEEEVKKAIRIIEVFIDDPDPYLPKDPNDVEHNEHARIEHGKGDPSITSVRGWCGWVLMKSAVLKGRLYIDDIIELTDKLTKDENYYVQHMACFALSQLASARLTHLEGTKEMFLDSNRTKALKKAKRIEQIAFSLLERIATYKTDAKNVLAKSLLTVFTNIRSLNQQHAELLITILNKKFPPEAVGEAAPLFIFFAEFRKNAYKNWEWKEEGLFDDLEVFDDTPFKKILTDLLKSNNVEIRKQFTFKFSILPDEGEELFDVSLKYLNLIADQDYDDEICRSIYTYFIPKQIDKHFKESYALWKKCLVKEVEALNENYKKQIPNSVPNWLEQYHDEILLKVKKIMGDDVFLNDLELFTKLPKGINFYSIGDAINKLKEFPLNNKQVERIYDALIDRDPSYYDAKMLWLGNK